MRGAPTVAGLPPWRGGSAWRRRRRCPPSFARRPWRGGGGTSVCARALPVTCLLCAGSFARALKGRRVQCLLVTSRLGVVRPTVRSNKACAVPTRSPGPTLRGRIESQSPIHRRNTQQRFILLHYSFRRNNNKKWIETALLVVDRNNKICIRNHCTIVHVSMCRRNSASEK